jgi:hypothetical protein
MMADVSSSGMLATLAPVIVGGVIGLAGGWLGPWFLERRKEKAEKKKLRAQKFEELVGAVVEHYHWITAKQFLLIAGQGREPNLSPMIKIEAITSTYFPEFTMSVRKLDSASNEYESWIYGIGQKRVRNEPGYENLPGHHDVLTKYTDARADLLVELKVFARREFQ